MFDDVLDDVVVMMPCVVVVVVFTNASGCVCGGAISSLKQ